MVMEQSVFDRFLTGCSRLRKSSELPDPALSHPLLYEIMPLFVSHDPYRVDVSVGIEPLQRVSYDRLSFYSQILLGYISYCHPTAHAAGNTQKMIHMLPFRPAVSPREEDIGSSKSRPRSANDSAGHKSGYCVLEADPVRALMDLHRHKSVNVNNRCLLAVH